MNERLTARTVTVKLRYGNVETHTKAKTLEAPTDSLEELRSVAFECLGRFGLKRRVRLIGIRLSGFAKTCH